MSARAGDKLLNVDAAEAAYRFPLPSPTAREGGGTTLLRRSTWLAVATAWLILAPLPCPAAAPTAEQASALAYVKKGSRAATQAASIEASLALPMPAAWQIAGPFAAHGGQALSRVYPPEVKVDLGAEMPGADGPVRWKEAKLADGKLHKLNKQFASRDDRVCFLYRQIEAPRAMPLRVSLGFDDALVVYLNGRRVLSRPASDGAFADQEFVTLDLQVGKNDLLLKLANRDKDWAFYFQPTLGEHALAALERRLDADFPPTGEAQHYRIERLPLPDDELIEVGGLAFRPDGKLYVGTRRGDVWLVDQPTADDPSQTRMRRFATGLHEVLGVLAEGERGVVLAQRPELTLARDTDGDDVADEFTTVCDRFGVSGDYHEFHYGPVRDATGDFLIALNLSLASSDFARVPYRGCVLRVERATGEARVMAGGFRSPNGLGVDPQGRLFCTDNQGEWIPACKLQEVRADEYYGHPASAKWLPGHADGAPPEMTPPAVWFPFGTCRSATEPIWDASGGKFGPFAGQCFVGELTNALVLRVMLEEVGGRLQGACVQFRKGFGSGVNRLAQAPDGSLIVGQTNRGWGSLGGRPHGLDRVVFTGRVPLEIAAIHATREGWELRFTLPLSPALARDAKNYAIDSYTYHHWDKYGSPEIDRQPLEVSAATLSDDGQSVRLTTAARGTGRVYRIRVEHVVSTDSAPLLHREAFYTLNALP